MHMHGERARAATRDRVGGQLRRRVWYGRMLRPRACAVQAGLYRQLADPPARGGVARTLAARRARIAWTMTATLRSESLLAPEVRMGIVVVVRYLSVAGGLVEGPGRGRAVEPHDAVTEVACGVLQRPDERAREPASPKPGNDVHALDLAGAAAQRLHTPAARRHAVEQADDERPARRREVGRRRRGAAAELATGDDVVLVQQRVDELARGRPPCIASAELQGHAP